MHIEPEQLFARPEFAQRLRTLRSLCFGIMVLLSLVLLFVSLVVWYALGGRPLAGNGALLMGIPILTVFGAILTLNVPFIALLVVGYLSSSGVERVAKEPPEVPNPGADLETDAERLWRVYAAGRFTEYALAEGAILVCAILFHMNADWLLIGFAVSMILFMLTRFPTLTKAKAWFAEASARLERLRGEVGK